MLKRRKRSGEGKSPMRKFLLYLGLIIFLTIGGFAYYSLAFNYSEGYRVGTVVKLSKKGTIFKTWEGELKIGDASADFWEFSVPLNDEKVRNEINDAAIKGYRVKLIYDEKVYAFQWRGDTRYFVKEVEKVVE